MIQTYDQTWQFYTRLMRYTTRRCDFMPYCTLKSIDAFLRQHIKGNIIDWGCGENNHKLAYNCSHMIGVDRTLEADIYGYPIDVWDEIPRTDAILAVNSLHFSKDVYLYVERIIDEKLHVGGEIFFTINNTGRANARDYANITRWKGMGEVLYYWCMSDHEQQIEKDLAEFIYVDRIAHLISTEGSEMYNRIHDQTIMQDPFHGLLRIKIRKE